MNHTNFSIQVSGASFADRFAAKLIDSFLLLIPWLFLHFSTLPYFGPTALSICYYVFFEASFAQATPGKRLAGIYVVSLNGSRISLKQAFMRMLFRFLSFSLFCLPYLAVFFTKRRQAMHDLISDTVVVVGKNNEPLIESWLLCFKRFLHEVQAVFKKAK